MGNEHIFHNSLNKFELALEVDIMNASVLLRFKACILS